MKHLYYAIFTPDHGGYAVDFPDLEGAFTCGDNMSDALYMASDLLEGWLLVAEDEKDPIPRPSQPDELEHEADELLIPIEVDLKIAREKHENRLVKKTLTIPSYLNELGKDQNINFSQTLTQALEEKLGV